MLHTHSTKVTEGEGERLFLGRLAKTSFSQLSHRDIAAAGKSKKGGRRTLLLTLPSFAARPRLGRKKEEERNWGETANLIVVN